MDLNACKECGKEVSAKDQLCPHCGIRSPVKGQTLSREGLVGIVIFIVIALFLAINKPSTDATSSNSKKNTGVQNTVAPPPIEEKILSKEETSQALSEYMLKFHAKLISYQYMQQIMLGKIRQDIQFMALDKYQADAESFKKLALNFQNEIFAIPYPNEDSLDEKYIEAFDRVTSEANTLAGSYLIVAADIAASAHTGIDFSKELAKDSEEIQKSKKAFDKTVLATYKQLGVPSSLINKENFTLLDNKLNPT